MALGLALALSQVANQHALLPDGAVARVNQRLISRADYAKAMQAMQADLRRTVTVTDRQHVLDQLINEELLFQHALQLGLAHSDARVRSTLVSTLLDEQRLQADAQAISDTEAREFYQRHPQLFAGQWRYRVGLLQLDSADTAEQVQQQLNQGADFAALAEQYPQDGALRLPGSFLPLSKLRDYLGATLSTALTQLQPGQASAPMARGQGWLLAYLFERQQQTAPEWNVLEPQVLAEIRRRRAEALLQKRLAQLRKQAHLRVRDDL